MKTISDCIIAKQDLERDILKLIQLFERTYSVHVSYIVTDAHYQIQSQKPCTYLVECKIEL